VRHGRTAGPDVVRWLAPIQSIVLEAPTAPRGVPAAAAAFRLSSSPVALEATYAGMELSVLCEPVSTWRSSAYELTPSGSKHLPLHQGGGAAFLECGAVDEVAFLGEVVVERGVYGSELLQ